MELLRAVALLLPRLALQLLQIVFGVIASIAYSLHKGFGNMEDSVRDITVKMTSHQRKAARKGRLRESVVRDIEAL